MDPEAEARLKKYLSGDRDIPKGLGTKESACSVAAINLALTGELTDDIPECMSSVLGDWIIVIQDVMPDTMRNSQEWRQLLPLAAGTGRHREKEIRVSILAWMWEKVLPSIQPIAKSHGFGPAWETMTTQRTAEAAWAAAAKVSAAAKAAWTEEAAGAEETAWKAAKAAWTEEAAGAEETAWKAAWVAKAAAWTAETAETAEAAAWTAKAAAETLEWVAAWETFSPVQCLHNIISPLQDHHEDQGVA